MGSITFKKGEGGLSRTLPGKDHVCGLLFVGEDVPKFFNGVPTVKISSLKEAESMGLTSDATEQTARVANYHLRQFFEVYNYMNVRPELYLHFAYKDLKEEFYGSYHSIMNMQKFAGGEIRNFGVWTNRAFDSKIITTLQSVLTELENKYMPASCLLNMDCSYTAFLNEFPNLRELNAPKVSLCFSEDLNRPDLSISYNLGCIGAWLAWTSIKGVHENIGNVENFNVAFNGEYDTPQFCNGEYWENADDHIQKLEEKGYIYLMKHTGITGTYFDDSHTCTALTSDYCYIENNQTIDKAIRKIRAALLPKLNGVLQIDPDTGFLAVTTVSNYLAINALERMTAAGELSGYGVYIDPEQNVLSNSTLEINVKLVCNGIARNINVSIGFTNKL